MGARTALTNACRSLSSWMYAIDLASKCQTIRLPRCGRVSEEQELQPETGSLNEPPLNRPAAKNKSTYHDSVLCGSESCLVRFKTLWDCKVCQTKSQNFWGREMERTGVKRLHHTPWKLKDCRKCLNLESLNHFSSNLSWGLLIKPATPDRLWIWSKHFSKFYQGHYGVQAKKIEVWSFLAVGRDEKNPKSQTAYFTVTACLYILLA